MGATTLVSVDEYLRTSFPDADREYVDGRIVERNVGEVDHSDVQSSIVHYLRTHYKKGVWAGVEVRVQVKKTRFRIPDVTVMAGSKPAERIIRKPPVVAVEVLSPDDRAGELEEKINDYLAFGVSYIWVINPDTRRAYVHTPAGSHEAKDGILRAESAGIAVPLSGIFT
ncbi:MAG TPA: Uma2 family endonuclease [Bryobacteraceae bacterium]|nr:Uma2 family endonuclease [Bryobacteraceae bacterium]